MTDVTLHALLAAIDLDNLETILVLSDWLEEQGDPRATQLHHLYVTLYDLWMFAPRAFRHYGVLRNQVLALFPEYPGDTSAAPMIQEG